MASKSIIKNKRNKVVNRELLNLFQENDDVEDQKRNETAKNVNSFLEAIHMIRCYVDITETYKKINRVYW